VANKMMVTIRGKHTDYDIIKRIIYPRHCRSFGRKPWSTSQHI